MILIAGHRRRPQKKSHGRGGVRTYVLTPYLRSSNKINCVVVWRNTLTSWSIYLPMPSGGLIHTSFFLKKIKQKNKKTKQPGHLTKPWYWLELSDQIKLLESLESMTINRHRFSRPRASALYLILNHLYIYYMLLCSISAVSWAHSLCI